MSSSVHQGVNPSEVGWQFVPQYYTFVNKQPGRLHCFYTKSSTFTHGTEGEEIKSCKGQEEIHRKITSIGFEDCRVFIHSVDAQNSAGGGIIVQVIGEMSNHGDAWKKFVQTFFLAEQPNGYYVLNDIFRFLKEESVEDDMSETDLNVPVPEQLPAYVPPKSPPPTLTVFEPESPAVPVESITPPSPPAPIINAEEPTTVMASFPSPPPVAETELPEPNGILLAEQSQSFATCPSPVIDTTEVPPVPSGSPSPVAPSPSETFPVVVPFSGSAPPQSAAPVHQSPVPVKATPKSWASLAATDLKRWGAAVAQESKGLSEAPAPSSTPTTRTSSHGPHGHRTGQQHKGTSVDGPSYATEQQCFVKGLSPSLLHSDVISAVHARLSDVDNISFLPNGTCAIFSFKSIDAAKQAMSASSKGEEGQAGILIHLKSSEQPCRISIEPRKERSERLPNRSRGGGPMNGDSRGGGYRGRGGPGRGRGYFPPK